MYEPAATLERGKGESQPVAAGEPAKPGGGGMRFSFTNGDRPLDGYTIKRGVGVGGFGEVYFATSDAGKEVALKRVQRNLDVEVRGVTHCLNLKHANLIALYDIKYDDQGDGWIVMEYVNGESLKDVLERNPNGLPRDEVKRWFSSIAAGVACLHDHGIVHRDLKPGNIFQDGEIIKIGDYGLSKFISCSRRSGQTESVGTFHYMAPEIGNGNYGKEIDVYALGIILYEMLTGTVPFNGETSQEIIMKHLTADPVLSDVESPYRRVIEKALYKDPSKRYRNVTEMMEALSEHGAAAPVESHSQRQIPPVVGPPRPSRRAPNKPTQPETLYITDENADEMVFGPVIEVVDNTADPATRHDRGADGNTARRSSSSPVSQRPAAATSTGATVVIGAAAADGGEPIARAIKQSFRRSQNWWNNANLSTPVKVILMVVGIFVLLVNVQWLVPLLIMAGAAYLVYFGLRALILALQGAPASTPPPVSAPATAAAMPAASPARPRPPAASRKERYLTALRKDVAKKTPTVRMAELTGSCLMAAIVTVVMSLVMLVLSGVSLDGSPGTLSLFAWVTLTSVLGTWVLLAISKTWEGTDGDAVYRRFAMLVVGLLFGAFAYGLSQLLLVTLVGSETLVVHGLPTEHIPDSMYASDGTPQIGAFLAYFGLLFLLVRWWRQADPLRKTRFSIWTVFVCVVAAWLMHLVWQFPQPWGFMLAANISVATQLASPWVNAKQRAEVRQQVREAWEVS